MLRRTKTARQRSGFPRLGASCLNGCGNLLRRGRIGNHCLANATQENQAQFPILYLFVVAHQLKVSIHS
jgi:hypothetical protein